MDARARAWFERRTSSSSDWAPDRLLEAKGSRRISVVVPARDEAATIGEVVRRIQADLVEGSALVDELVVMDSLSSDATARVAADAGARVWSVADVVPELGVRPGKGEALWKSLFVAAGDLLVFIDADLTEWRTDFVSGLLGPLLAGEGVDLVKGFYDRVLDTGSGTSVEGGRVTELVARPWLAVHRPELGAVVQPLAGEWAIRRTLFEQLPVPVGYGVEIATLLDTAALRGLDAVAQVDLGRRAHRHQNLHNLGAMATELLTVADRRRRPGVLEDGGDAGSAAAEVVLARMGADREWTERSVPVLERPAAITLAEYASRSG